MAEVDLKELVGYADWLMEASEFKDYCPNGLQVEGRPRVGRIISGVTACQALIDEAIERRADALVVHHGYFWKNEDPCVRGMKQRRFKALLEHDISVIAYHLPLDAHRELGNNARLADSLGLRVEGWFGGPPGRELAVQGRFARETTPDALKQRLESLLGRQILLESGGPDTIQTLGVCSGGAQGMINQAAELGLDAFMTGEVSEQTIHIAREMGLHFFACGHHATERMGAQALGEHLAEKFGLEHEFVDIDNPA